MKIKKPLEIILLYLQENKGNRIPKRDIVSSLPEYGRKITKVLHSPIKYDRIFSILIKDKITLTNANISLKEISINNRQVTYYIGEA